MRDLDLRRWIGAGIGIVAGSFAVVVNYLQGDVVVATLLLALFAGLFWWSWPGRRGVHVSHATAQAEAGERDVVVYWRPG